MVILMLSGVFLLGIVLGFLSFREFFLLASKNREGRGSCGLCGSEGHLVSCRRCGRRAAMCCYFRVLGCDDPAPRMLRTRRALDVCIRCVLPDEKEILERMLG